MPPSVGAHRRSRNKNKLEKKGGRGTGGERRWKRLVTTFNTEKRGRSERNESKHEKGMRAHFSSWLYHTWSTTSSAHATAGVCILMARTQRRQKTKIELRVALQGRLSPQPFSINHTTPVEKHQRARRTSHKARPLSLACFFLVWGTLCVFGVLAVGSRFLVAIFFLVLKLLVPSNKR